jgi:uncharacterized cupredoxin-like copper-binding protein
MENSTVRVSAAILIAAFALAIVPLTRAASAHAASSSQSASVTTIKVKAGEFFFRLSKRSIAKPGTVKFVVTNVGHVLHDFKIHGKATRLLQPGKTAKLTVRFTKKGRFRYLCTVPGHASAGMRGTFTIR